MGTSRKHTTLERAIGVLLALSLLFCGVPLVPSYAQDVSGESKSIQQSDGGAVQFESSSDQFASGRSVANAAEDGSGATAAGQSGLQAFSAEGAESPTAPGTDAGTSDALAGEGESPSGEDAGSGAAPDSPAETPTLYAAGEICIYNFAQLALIGSGYPVTDADYQQDLVGTGQALDDGTGTPLAYSLHAVYRLMNDIEIPAGETWDLPAGFIGAFSNGAAPRPENPELYNVETDTLYLYNPYQLALVASETAAAEPVMTLDWDAAQVGMGQFIYPYADSGDYTNYLTYSPEHKYVIASSFTAEKPQMMASRQNAMVGDGPAAPYDGRDFARQVIKTVGTKEYILIGNAEQLKRIGTNEKVYSAVYSGLTGKNMVYGGDADLLATQNGTKNFSWSDRPEMILVALYIETYSSGQRSDTVRFSSAFTKTYSATENYIIFRDIDLSSVSWTPLMFSGTMIGAKAVGANKIWNEDSINSSLEGRPTISGVTVNQTAKMNASKYMGIGFFATITNEINVGNVGLSAGTTKVENIELNNVSVSNGSSEVVESSSLVSTITSGVGWIVGGIVDLLATVLTIGQVDLGLRGLLSELLNARTTDKTIFATGAFAGRIVGDVCIKNCAVTGNVSVSNVKDWTGGFVGYSEGVTQYSGLSDTLKLTVNVLSSLLNAIPGLGLGDLITVLLKNGLDVGSLVPTGYINPEITGCEVSGIRILGSDGNRFAGGFVGQQIGTVIQNCTVTTTGLTVNASQFAGGFAGLSRDAEIKGSLKSVGVDLVRVANPQSLLQECKVVGPVSVSSGAYSGGFVGALANSYAVNCLIQGEVDVLSTGNYAGGFSGFASVGWVSSIGKDETRSGDLLGAVKTILAGLLSKDPEQGGMLLSLIGVAPSAVLGCQITSSAVTVRADGNYAGGIIGSGDGVYLGTSNADALGNLSFWKYEHAGFTLSGVAGKHVTLSGLESVSAGGSFAGGVAGDIEVASVGALLNNTLGVASFLSSNISCVAIKGKDEGGYTVTAGADCAGGAFGKVLGANIKNVDKSTNVSSVSVEVSSLNKVEAVNYAGGFAGVVGPGSLASASGLSVSLLGLDLLSVENLLSLADGVSTEIEKACVSGIDGGFEVTAKGSDDSTVTEYAAGGFIAKSDSTQINDAAVKKLKSVTAPQKKGFAGGFLGISSTGGLASAAGDAKMSGLLEVGKLIDAGKYLIPSYKSCWVEYVAGGGVEADTAGGFVGELQGGTVNNSAASAFQKVAEDGSEGPGYSKNMAVYNIDHVGGKSYAGGFGGRVYSGAFASVADGGGLTVLGGLASLKLADVSTLVSVAESYVPFVEYAGVESKNGFTVVADGDPKQTAGSASGEADGDPDETTGGNGGAIGGDNEEGESPASTDDLAVGSAGGFIGYGSGVQVSTCNVTYLKHTDVAAPADLEAVDAPSYFNGSSYAVMGTRYAGGYIGMMDVGSVAALGGGLKLLGKSLVNLSGVLSALSVVVSTIEHSDVSGKPGGFAVLASGEATAGKVGMAGGFAGSISGGHIQNSNVKTFSYIIGQIAAGGYVGNFIPGNAANVVKEASILSGIINVETDLASVLETFVPTIRNSSTGCIPCGGAVRADAASDPDIQRGMAGGYVGHNEGGSIWGMDDHLWKNEKPYSGPQSRCNADRILSVSGAEFAGGYAGLMECADTAGVGGISLLGGLIQANNLLTAASVIYSDISEASVCGPLGNLTPDIWNSWIEYVGKYGGFGADLAKNGSVADGHQEALDDILGKYEYGYHVRAGRTSSENMANTYRGGCAGGFVGAMKGGVITDGQAKDAKQVTAMRSAGGYAGEMQTGGLASLGSASVLGLEINLGALLADPAQVFLPVIKTSSTCGYRAGLTVVAHGEEVAAGGDGEASNSTNGNMYGYAGGYVGFSAGGQIWGDAGDKSGCNVSNLRRVAGTNSAGGYVGKATAGSVADVNANASSGLLQGIINGLLGTPGNLASVLKVTMSTIRYAKVSAVEDWGFVVEGYNANGRSEYAKYAGGFAGSLEAAILGSSDDTTAAPHLEVENLRGVEGGLYAGGFFGLANVTSAASVAGGAGTDDELKILGLITAGEISVLDAFRSYVYGASVKGISEGAVIRALDAGSKGTLSEQRYLGCAGGFGGGLMDGTVKNSSVASLSTVLAKNYTGGFIGHLGKSGLVDADRVDIPSILNSTIGVVDLIGSQVYGCSVAGIDEGYVVRSIDGEEPVAGGFAGYADLARIDTCKASNIKKVVSDQVAGGFVGETQMSYLVNIDAGSQLVSALLSVVNILVKGLYLPEAQRLNAINVDLGIIGLKAFAEGDLIYVNLLGLKISVALSKGTNEGQTDVAIVTIGDSQVELLCNDKGIISNQDTESAIKVSLIKGNRAKVLSSEASGISRGYDVFGGGATDSQDGSGGEGYAGGFVGLNNEGLFETNTMTYCDVVRGESGLVGPFAGKTNLKSVYSFNTMESIEGNGNKFSIYRDANPDLAYALTSSRIKFADSAASESSYSRYIVKHYDKDVANADSKIKNLEDLKGAVRASDLGGAGAVPLDAWASPAKAVLMFDWAVADNSESLAPEPDLSQDPCSDVIDFTINKVWKDWGNWDKVRPASITVAIYQEYVDGEGNTVKLTDDAGKVVPFATVELTADENGSAWSATWNKIVSGLPVAFLDGYEEGVSRGTPRYYRYYIAEAPVPDYASSIVYDSNPEAADGYTATITNTHNPKLPFTGGNDWMFLLGILVLLVGASLYLRNRRKKTSVVCATADMSDSDGGDLDGTRLA